ncbi:hypothetical protein ISP15_16455 [Dyella jejuensis]|uniref:Uncharacterized protein n=1 Tax=Dyella jejuensis TaxID=1432009 RepID=A0ABW8JLE9_9GAMM
MEFDHWHASSAGIMTHQYGREFGMPALIELPASSNNLFGTLLAGSPWRLRAGLGMADMLKQQALFVHNRMMKPRIFSNVSVPASVPASAIRTAAW